MSKKSIAATLFAALSLFIMILDSKRALTGAQEGVSICLHTVIPSLLPFLFFSTILTENAKLIGSTVLRPLRWLWRISEGAERFLLVGLLGGYPTGAHCVSTAYERGQITKAEAQRLLAFCNNCGPAFIFGIVGNYFERAWQIWTLWLIHLISSAAVSWILPYHADSSSRMRTDIIGQEPILKRNLMALAQICGWVILFRMLITYMDGWFGFYLPVSVQPLLYGLLELTNGCLLLYLISDDGIRFVLCSAILAMGGFCITTQTVSIVSHDLEMKQYFLGKILQMSCSIVLSSLISILFFQSNISLLCPLFIGIFLAVFSILLRKNQKKSRFFPVPVV